MGREGGKVTVGCASMVLTYEHFSERIGALYVDLRQSAAEQAQFITNPARMISERIFDGRKLDAPETSERANLVLCALLGNSEFHKWIAEYELKLVRQLGIAKAQHGCNQAMRLGLMILDKRRLFKDLAEGLKEFGDTELFRAILPGDAALQNSDGVVVEGDSGSVFALITLEALVAEVAEAIDRVYGALGAATAATAQAAQSADLPFIDGRALLALHDFVYSAPTSVDLDKIESDAQGDGDRIVSIVSLSRIDLQEFAWILAKQAVVCANRRRAPAASANVAGLLDGRYEIGQEIGGGL
jgi:hypothetical protein